MRLHEALNRARDTVGPSTSEFEHHLYRGCVALLRFHNCRSRNRAEWQHRGPRQRRLGQLLRGFRACSSSISGRNAAPHQIDIEGQIRTCALQQIEVASSQESGAGLLFDSAGALFPNAVRCPHRYVAPLIGKLLIKRECAEVLALSNWQR